MQAQTSGGSSSIGTAPASQIVGGSATVLAVAFGRQPGSDSASQVHATIPHRAAMCGIDAGTCPRRWRFSRAARED